MEGPPSPEALAEIAARWSCDLDFERTQALVERHDLVF
jgi:hypothetical protein